MDMDIQEEDLAVVLMMGCPECRDNRISVTHNGVTHHPVVDTVLEDDSYKHVIAWGQPTDEPVAGGTVVLCDLCARFLYSDGAWAEDIANILRLYQAKEHWETKAGYIEGELSEALLIKRPIPIEVRFGEHDVAAIHHETQTWGCAKDVLSAIDELKRGLEMYCRRYSNRPKSRPRRYVTAWSRLFDEHIEKV